MTSGYDVFLEIRTNEFSKAVKEIALELRLSVLTVLIQQVKLWLIDVIHLTPPFGPTPTVESYNAQRKIGERAVAGDFSKAFGTLKELEILKSTEKVGVSLRRLLRTDLSALETVLRRMKVIGPNVKVIHKATAADHKKLRDKRGRVRRGIIPIYVVDKQSVRKLLKLAQDRVGWAKAGWLAAANGLGVKLPAWITRHTAKAKGLFTPELVPNSPAITVGNFVSHAQLHGSELHIINRALLRRTESMKRNLEFQYNRIAKRHNGK